MCIIQTFRHKSAVLKLKPTCLEDVLHLDYFGVLSGSTIGSLWREAANHGESANALVIRIDRAVLAYQDMAEIAESQFRWQQMPGAIIVRPDQECEVREYCRQLASIGLLRLSFLEDELDLAYQWADQQADLYARQKSRQRQQQTQASFGIDRFRVSCRKNEPMQALLA